MPTTSANMGLTVPTPSTGVTGTGDPGPGYATNISNDLTTIDSHDHSFGKGVQVTPAGMNINADLPIGGNNITSARAVRFTSQASALNLAGDKGEIFDLNGDLWWINGSGTLVQVTANSGLGTGPIGPTGPAGTSAVNAYFQAGVTGATGLSLYANACMVPWTQPNLAVGGISTPTSVGTGASWVMTTAAGLYDVTYRIGFTGVVPFFANVYQTLNATGANANSSPVGGTAVAASMQAVSLSLQTGVNNFVQGRYLVQLGPNTTITTWVGAATGAGAVSLIPTGTLFTVAKVG